MEDADLVETFPALWHVTAPENWENIRRFGLLSTSAILDLFEVEPEERQALERARRAESVPLCHAVHGRAILRDNKPLHESRLEACLTDGLAPSEWFEILNSRVFFWPIRDRVETLLGAAAYRTSEQLVIEVSTARLLELCRDRVELSPMNSGATRPFAHPRGRGTFTPLEDYDFEGWRKKRSRRKAVVEVTVRDRVGVDDELISSAVVYGPGGSREELWQTDSA